MPVGMTIQGGKELARRLEALPLKTERTIMRKALRDGAKVVRDAAKARAPVRTGLMRKAITVRAQKRRRRGEVGLNVVLDAKRHPGLVKESAEGKRSFYPAVVEYGAEGRAANPFMRPAVQSSRHEVERVVRDALSDGIVAAAKG